MIIKDGKYTLVDEGVEVLVTDAKPLFSELSVDNNNFGLEIRLCSPHTLEYLENQR